MRSYRQRLVYFRVFNHYCYASRPDDLRTFDLRRLPQAKVRYRFHLAEVAASGVNGADLRPSSGSQSNQSATGGSPFQGKRKDTQEVIVIGRGVVEAKRLRTLLAM